MLLSGNLGTNDVANVQDLYEDKAVQSRKSFTFLALSDGHDVNKPNISSCSPANKTENSNTTDLVNEVALAISYNGINQAVMMVSPTCLEDFVQGFSLSNGYVDTVDEIYDIAIRHSNESVHAEIEISGRAFWHLKARRRHLAGTSGCGICGLEALEQALPKLSPLKSTLLPSPNHFNDIRKRISAVQHAALRTGALHAAIYIDQSGDIKLCREDIGRHNALDKLIGALSTHRFNAKEGFTVVTSRCSLELIQKAIRTQIGTLATFSAPTALAVTWARKYGLNLIHIPHTSAPRVYSPDALGS